MDKLKNAILRQLDGQRGSRFCPTCGKETLHVYNGAGMSSCLSCGKERIMDL